MKRFFTAVLAATILLSALFTFCVSAENEISVYINGTKITSDVPPMIINDRTMVPVRAIFEALGAEVTWDEATRTAISNRNGIEIKITIGENRLFKNGEEIALDVPAQIVDSRTLVPARAIAESYDCKVFWDGENRIVRILTFDLADPVLTESDNKIVMKVGDIEVSEAELNIYISAVEQLGYSFTQEELREYALGVAKQYCASNVVAKEKGISISQVDADALNAGIYYLINNGTYGSMLSVYKTTDAALREYIFNSMIVSLLHSVDYNISNEQLLSVADENYVRVKHILVEDEQTAQKVISEINNGKSFEDAVREYSFDGMDVDKGYVFTSGEMVAEFEIASFALAEGEMSEPVKSAYGYHIIKKYPMSEVSDYILETKGEELKTMLVQKLVIEEIDKAIEDLEVVIY